MNKTKRVYINTVTAIILVSLLFIDNLSSHEAVVATTSSTAAVNATEPLRNNTTTGGGSTNNTTNTTTATQIVNDRLENATSSLENTTAALTNATKSLQGISSIIPTAPGAPPPATTTSTNNATAVNTTTVINSIFENNLPTIFIIAISSIIGVPLVLDIILAYRRKPPAGSSSTDSANNNRVVGMPDLYRSLMTFGIIVLVGTVIFYLLALITLNINNSASPALQSLIDVLKSLGTILGTALATIIAFYFGTKAAESATEKATTAAAATTAAVTKAGVAAPAASEKEPPKVLNTIPADGATQVPVNSLISATFSEPMSSPTINENTFTVRRADDESTLIKGSLSLSPDNKSAIFDPEQDFSPNTKYFAEINTGAKDVTGNALASTKRWSFTTTTTTT
jgi:Bacterial Ig-like domain